MPPMSVSPRAVATRAAEAHAGSTLMQRLAPPANAVRAPPAALPIRPGATSAERAEAMLQAAMQDALVPHPPTAATERARRRARQRYW